LEFDDEKNGITPDKVTFTNTNEEIWWICPTGHEFQRSIAYRNKQFRDCPICNRSIVVKGVNDFQTAFPDIIDIWDYEANGRGPDNISDKNNGKYTFKCECGHHYETQLVTIIANDFECLVCKGKIIQEGINSLLDTHNELAKEFSPNEERKPTEFTKNSAYSAKWQCPVCSGEYSYPINEREVGDDSCPFCRMDRVLLGYNSLIDTHFDLSKEWSPLNERGPETYIKSFKSWVSWLCPTCSGEYRYPINEREVGDDSCPYCRGDRVLLDYNSLVDTDFDLSKEWSTLNYRGPETYTKSSKSWVSWQCSTCSGEYRYPINEREVGDDSCPYCRKDKVLPGYNSLVETDLDLLKEWSSSNERGPETYLKTCKNWVVWLCPTCSGEYRYPINEREIGDDSCPYCKGTRVLAGFNSFKQNHSDLMEEWDDIDNYLLCDADNILDSCSDKVWWICKVCNHKYQMSPKQRIYYQKRHMKSCPHCKGLRQKKKHFF
jgi:RNase P subunit RPR2